MAFSPTEETLKTRRVKNDTFSRLPFLRLDKNENTSGFPEEFVRSMMAGVTPAMLAAYPETFLLQEKLARFLRVEEDRLMLSSGSDAAIKSCFETFMSKGDILVRIDPTYAMVGIYASLFGVREKIVQYDGEMNLNVGAVIAAIRGGAKMVYVANPNSPTGTLIPLSQIREICLEARKADAAILVDEAYYYFSPVTAFDLLGEFENLIVCRTFSKAVGLASVRLGYMLSSKKVINWLSRWRPIYEVNAFAQYCGCYMLNHWDMVETYYKDVIETRRWFSDELRAMGFHVWESEANFILVKYPPAKIDTAVSRFRQERVLLKGGGGAFPFSEALRFSIGGREQMRKVLSILRDLDGR